VHDVDPTDPTSMWLTTATPDSPLLERAGGPPGPKVDVVVVGAGLAGLCTAVLCLQSGATVAVVEAGRVAGRTTGHSTAKLTALHGLTYAQLARGKGAEAAAAYAAANVDAMTKLRAHIAATKIHCDLVHATAYTCAATADGVRAVEEEAEAARTAGLDVEVMHTTELTLPVERAVALGGQAHFDPVALARGLVEQLRAGGAHVVEHQRITDIEESPEGCVVRGPGFELRSDAVVVTTHLPIVDPAFLAGRIKPERSYVVSGPVETATMPTGMYLAHDAGWSVRPWHPTGSSDVGRSGGMLLVGGEGHPMTDHVEGAPHYERLRAFARDRLGVDVRHQWSAFDYTTTDGVPFIGRLSPGSQRRYTATGFHKWGMSTSMVAAMIISDSIAGRPNPYSDTFDSTRILPTVSRDLFHNNARVAARFFGDRFRARSAPDDLPDRGEGVVVRRGGERLAISRDHDGVVRAVRAACTHLGCIVQFNGAEQTWDCPCHGSRFGLDGAVIDGPASEPLAMEPAAADAAKTAGADGTAGDT
jgi:glycine/D-amino acid oxidase-like deaminating enzyme/nitrite reductase/ring-hydroxylating ferredoxin subunit